MTGENNSHMRIVQCNEIMMICKHNMKLEMGDLNTANADTNSTETEDEIAYIYV